jgi:UDP-glucose 4-epimerase
MVRHLARHGLEVVTLDNLVTGHRDAVRWGEFVQGDVRDAAVLDALFSRCRFAAVFHFAALSVVAESVRRPGDYHDNNVGGVRALLAAMRQHDVRQLIFSSTAAVYGMPRAIPIREDHPTTPINPYGESKRAAETLIAQAGEEWRLHAVSLRYFNAAGAETAAGLAERHEPESHLIPRVLAACREKSVVSVYGNGYGTPDGTCVRDFIHVTDLCEAHVAALEYLRRAPGTHVFNLGNGRGFSVLEVIQAAQGVTGARVDYRIEEPRPGDPPVLVADATRARRELGWFPGRSRLEDMIASAWDALMRTA